MLFLNKKEVNYELYYKNTFTKIILNKKNYTNKYILKKPKIEFYFWTRKVKEENLSLTKLYNICIFFWLSTGKLGKIKNLNVRLIRGIRYYRYTYICKAYNFFKTLNFINETLYSAIYKNTIHKHYNGNSIYLNSYSDLSTITNLKLSKNFYFNSINNKFFLIIYKNKNIYNLNIFLNCLKLQ